MSSLDDEKNIVVVGTKFHTIYEVDEIEEEEAEQIKQRVDLDQEWVPV